MVYPRKQHEVGGYMVVVLSAEKRKPSKVWRVQNRRLGGGVPSGNVILCQISMASGDYPGEGLEGEVHQEEKMVDVGRPLVVKQREEGRESRKIRL